MQKKTGAHLSPCFHCFFANVYYLTFVTVIGTQMFGKQLEQAEGGVIVTPVNEQPFASVIVTVLLPPVIKNGP